MREALDSERKDERHLEVRSRQRSHFGETEQRIETRNLRTFDDKNCRWKAQIAKTIAFVRRICEVSRYLGSSEKVEFEEQLKAGTIFVETERHEKLQKNGLKRHELRGQRSSTSKACRN